MPTSKAVNGSVYVSEFYQNSIEGYDYWAQIRSDGTFQMALPDGRYKLKAGASGQWQNYFGVQSDSITVTSTPQVVNLTLEASNVSGTISPIDKSRGGWGQIEILTAGRWDYAAVSFSVKDNGQYEIYLEPGTYRARISPNPDATGIYRLLSDSFTVLDGCLELLDKSVVLGVDTVLESSSLS